MMSTEQDPYRGRTRVRVNGLLVEENSLLLVQLHSPVSDSLVWMPPGGEVEAAETMHGSLVREFLEETGLEVDVGALRYVNELLEPPYHAIEFYFLVSRTSGQLQLGTDPEHNREQQLLRNIAFIDFAELDRFPVVPGFLQNRLPVDLREEYAGVRYYPSAD